jgi:TP901 family phage tail tape measure protein
MGAKTFGVVFSIGAALGSTYQSTMTRASKQVGVLSGRIRAMDKIQAQAGQFSKLQKGLSVTSTELVRAREHFAGLKKEMVNAGPPSKAMSNKLAAAALTVNRLENRLKSERRELGGLRQSLSAAGVSTSKLAAAQEKLAKKTEKARKAQAKLQSAMTMKQGADNRRSEIGGQIIGAALPVMALAAPLKVAADFEQAMAEVKAISGATSNEFRAMEETAKRLGATTSFTASEAAAGMKYLAMAGFKTNETIAAMPGVLNLARAGNTDLALSSDIASDMLSAFRLKAEDMGMLGDVLTKTFTTSNTTLELLGETMKYVGPAAASAGVSLQEAAAMAGLLGDVGIKGSEAGTALRASLIRLSAPPKAAADALAVLNVETTDAEGNLRNIPGIFADLAKAMEGMGSADKLGYIRDIFGIKPASAMAELLNKSSSGDILAKINLVTDSKGASKKIADEMENTTMGAMRRFASAMEGLQISAATLFLPVVQDITAGLTKIAGVMTSLTQRFPVATRMVGLLAAGFVGAKVAILASTYVVTSFMSTFAAIKMAIIWVKGLNIATKLAAALQWAWNVALNANPIGLVIAGVAALAGAAYLIYKNWEPIKQFLFNLWDTVISKIAWLIPGVGQFAAGANLVFKHWEPLRTFFVDLWEKIKGMFGAAKKLMNIIPGFGGDDKKVKGATADEANAMFSLDSASAGLSKAVQANNSVSQNNNINVTVNAQGSDPESTKRAVQAGVNNGVMDSRRQLARERRLAYE